MGGGCSCKHRQLQIFYNMIYGGIKSDISEHCFDRLQNSYSHIRKGLRKTASLCHIREAFKISDSFSSSFMVWNAFATDLGC